MTGDADRAANMAALDCVSQFVQSDHRRDLIRYRARLHKDIVIRADHAVIVQGADEAALVAVREWALAPDSLAVAAQPVFQIQPPPRKSQRDL